MALNSMTGFGRFRTEVNGRTVTVDVQSVNSKQIDINLRIPFLYKSLESDIRQRVTQAVERGKVDVHVHVESVLADDLPSLNLPLASHYIAELRRLQQSQGVHESDLLAVVSRMPDVFKARQADPSREELNQILETLDGALSQLGSFRVGEGKRLAVVLMQQLDSILAELKAIEVFEPERIVKIRERLQKNLDELARPEAIDANRLEQEMVYYLEKLDFTEEKVRLKSHCEFFLEVMKDPAPGKKLGFIAQEIGREINTLGAKASHAGIQHHVVRMKEELEKIKEQLLNIL